MAKFRETEHKGYYTFTCPGCGSDHFVNTNPDIFKVVWQFNGDLNKPTVSPSLLVQWDLGPEKTHHVCHFFIQDGRIQFLNDCTHNLAGQTIDLPEINHK